MNESFPPPIPPVLNRRNVGGRQRATASGRGPEATYNFIADKVGGVPNLRKKDNLQQAVTVGFFLIIALIVGWAVGGWPAGILLGAVGGLIAGILISGLVLMILGLCRKS